MSRLIALDTETTGLDPEIEDVFEIATIDLSTDEERVWRLEPRPEVLERMHPRALEVNRYYDRRAEPGWAWDDPVEALLDLYDVLHGAHIVGAVPDFDARFLTATYRRHRLATPRWHYHLIDVEAMAVGWLRGRHAWSMALPWRSDDLARACGVEPPAPEERHTALGDARGVARWYRALTEEER